MTGLTSGLLLTIALFVASTRAQCTVERAKPMFKRATYEFTVALSKRIAQETDNHFVFSPLSLWTLVSAISEGADSSTLDDIKQVLHHHPHKCFNNKYYEIAKNVLSTDYESTLEHRGLLLFDESLGVKEDYKNEVVKLGIGNVMSLPFTNFGSIAYSINEYMQQYTHDHIKEFINNSEDIALKYLLLLDAIYFTANWQKPLRVIREDNFYNTNGEQIGMVEIMSHIDNYNYTSLQQINATVLELPYTGEKYSMLIFLPSEGETVNNLIENLKIVTLQSIYNKFADNGPQLISVNLPKFEMSSNLDNLKELLTDMGLRRIFDESEAKFPFVSEYSIYVSDIIQRADVEVIENGYEYSEWGIEDNPTPFQANRPFVFLIVDKINEVVLLSGAYSKPSIYN